MTQSSSVSSSELTVKAQDAIKDFHSAFKERNPSSLQAYEASCSYLPGGNTRTVLHTLPFPLTFDSGKGSTLTSIDGDTYIDFLGEYTAGVYGHNNPTIRAAIDRALDNGWSFGGNNRHEKELAKIVCQRFRLDLVRFTNSGTEANMMAVATAIAWTGRKKVLVFDKGYHGATLSFRAATPGKSIKSVNLPHDWIIGTYNDIVETKEVLDALPVDGLAAILVEPMLGSGGAIPGSLPFLRLLKEYSSSHGALLILDEVMTSRLSYSGLGHKLGIEPDLMTLGKWVGGGMNFGAFGGRREIMRMYDPQSGSLVHAGTFNNNILSMAAGCAGCGILDQGTTDRLNDLGESMKASVQKVIDGCLYTQQPRINGLCQLAPEVSFPVNSNDVSANDGDITGLTNGTHFECQSQQGQSSPKMWVSGIGSILVIHFAPSTIQPILQSLYFHHMLSEDIYLAERGFIALSIEIGKEQIEAFVTATGRFVKKYQDVILGARQ